MIRPGLWRRDFSMPLQTLQGELNRLIEGYWNPIAGSTAHDPAAPTGPGWVPPIDLFETPTELVLQVDLPGVDPSTIHLALAGSLLTIEGEKATLELAEPTERTRERSTGSFRREVMLPCEVDFDHVQAESKNGVLTVRLPRQGAARPRTIAVRTV